MQAEVHRATREPCEYLPWDSEFWGIPIARARGDSLTPESVAAIDHWCEERDIACLYFLATFDDSTTVRCAEDGRFHLVDARVTLGRTPHGFDVTRTTCSPGTVIRSAVERDVDMLRLIARKLYGETRFYFDPNFPDAKCQRLYERWIIESCRGFADQVLIAAAGGSLVGYVTCHMPSGDWGRGSIGLVGVAADARGRGVGRALLAHALGWFATQRVSHVSVSTQGRNIQAQAQYQRCGFVTESYQLWYHKWYRPFIVDTP